MPGLTESRMSVIRTLIDAAPDSAIRSLDMALSADSSGGPMATIREMVAAEAEQRRTRSMTFGPLAKLCPAVPTMRHECFPPKVMRTLWTALKTEQPDAVAAAVGASLGWKTEAIDPVPFDHLVTAAAAGLRAGGPAFSPSVAMLEAIAPGSAARFAAYLDLVPLARRSLDQLPEWLIRMTDERAAGIRLAFRDAVTVAPDAGPRFIEILLAQLDEPWHVLRVVSGLMDRPSDDFMAGSELAHIGERLLREVDMRLEALRNFDPQAGLPAGVAAAEDARVVVQCLIEFDQTLDIKREGLWGGKIAKQRRELSQIVELRLSKADDAVEKALPLKSVKIAARLVKGVPKLQQEPDERAIAKAEGFLAFLDRTRASAAVGGFAALRHKMVEKLEDRLDQYAEDLIEELRNADSPYHERARQYLELCARFVGYVRDEKAAQIVRRRAAA
jgi:hypothetical protein